jgi:uncharacterized protein YhaN
MDKKALRFNKVSVKKMPGLKEGLKPFEDLSPNINIIAGPNASGKSSAARAIQQLIWQDRTEGMSAEGHFDMEETPWISVVDSTFKQFQKNGMDGSLEGIPAVESKNRYMLSLHDLIKADEQHLAEKILRDSIGGYDMDKAAGELGYRSTKTTKRAQQYSKYEEAEKDFRKKREEHEHLNKEQSGLQELYRDQKDAQEAQSLVEFYRLIFKQKTLADELSQLENSHSEFPAEMGKVRVEDFETIEELERQIGDQRTNIENAEVRIKQLANAREDLRLPDGGVDENHIRELRYLIDELEEADRTIRDLKLDITEEECLRKEASKQLGDDFDSTGFDRLDLSEVGQLDQFWQQAFDIFGDRRWKESQARDLKDQQKPYESGELIEKGIDALAKWLQASDRVSSGVSLTLIALVAVAVIGTALAVYFFGGPGLIGLLIVAALLFYMYRGDGSVQNGSLAIREKDFSETGLEGPDNWNAEEVAGRLNELITDLQESRWQEKLSDQLQNKEKELQNLKPVLDQVEEKADQLREKLGFVPDLKEENLRDYASLFWFLTSVKKWQAHHNSISAKNQSLEEAKALFEEKLSACNSIFTIYNLERADSLAGAKALSETLGSKNESYRELCRETEDREKEFDRRRKEKEKLEGTLDEVYKRLNVENGEKFKVKSLVDRLEAYTEITDDLRVKKREYKNAVLLVEGHEDYEREKEEIEALSIRQIEEKIEENQRTAGALDEIKKTITQIETRVKDVREKNDLEQALGRREEALLELQQLYEENLVSITGDLIVTHLKDHVGDQNMPDVFHRAKELFNRITRGRYELRVSGSDQPEFRAYDTLDKLGRPLDHLSTGTKIQLLMSVRLAFVEQSETTVKLPILADELLANSDDERAEAIIDALTEISSSGRQIFYFTAQEDEVAKWNRYMKGKKLPVKIYVIEEGNFRVDIDREPVGLNGIKLNKVVPEPGSATYDSYGKKLDVPAFNPLRDDVEQLHVWYLFDDPEVLYHCLTAGIEKWGMLKSYIQTRGIIEGLDEQESGRVHARAAVIEKYIELVRHGQNKPISREVLEDSGAVSTNFIDEVSQKLEECNYDPGKLIRSLRKSEVSGFRTNKIEELEEYLLWHGFIQANEPYSSEEIQIRLGAFISGSELRREDAEKLSDRIRDS